ncbi:MAG: signal peptidase I [Candidatus Nanopelagicales bacterium]
MPLRTPEEGPRRIIRAGALIAVGAVLVAVLVNRTVGEVRSIDSDSMLPTLAAGERVAVAKAGVDRWDLSPFTVVVFDAADLWADPQDPAGTVFVKRIVGVGGDRITCCTPEGALLRNGQPLAEPYLAGARSDQVVFDVQVKSDHYWLMGDNRADSADARDHLGDPGGGNVPASRIIGTVEAVVWPPGSMRRLEGLR